MYISIYIYIYIHTHIYIYINIILYYMHIHTHTHTYRDIIGKYAVENTLCKMPSERMTMYILMFMYVYVCICACVYTCTYTYAYAYIHTRTNTYRDIIGKYAVENTLCKVPSERMTMKELTTLLQQLYQTPTVTLKENVKPAPFRRETMRDVLSHP